MRNKSGIIHILPLILIGVLILGTSFYFYKRPTFEEITNKVVEESIENEEVYVYEPREVDTTNWNLYQNNKVGFKIYFPPDFDGPYEPAHPTLEGTIKFAEDEEEGTMDFAYPNEFSLSFSTNKDGKTYEDYIPNILKADPTIKAVNIQNFPIKNVDYSGMLKSSDINIYFGKGDYYYVARFLPDQHTTEEIMQILSTFEFTDYQKNCGGIAGFVCDEGYTCQMTETYPDAMGVCVKEVQESNQKELSLEEARSIPIFPPKNPIARLWCTYITRRCA